MGTTTLPPNKKAISNMWVYKTTKYKASIEVDHLKKLLVAKGYKQQLGVDYFEVFALVPRLDIVHMINSHTHSYCE